jgi:hypothetical protein
MLSVSWPAECLLWLASEIDGSFSRIFVIIFFEREEASRSLHTLSLLWVLEFLSFGQLLGSLRYELAVEQRYDSFPDLSFDRTFDSVLTGLQGILR